MSDLINRQAAIDALMELVEARHEWKSDASGEINGLNAAYCAIEDLPSAQPEQPEPEELDFVQPHKKIDVRLEIGQPDRSLWFRIGEICVDESKGFISAGRAVEKIRELLRETGRWEE